MRTALAQRFAAAKGGLPRVFWTLWFGLIVNRLASFVLAFLSIYLVRARGFTPVEAGRVLALYGFGMMVSGPLGGLLADQIGRRTTMLTGLVLGALAVGALAWRAAAGAEELWGILSGGTLRGAALLLRLLSADVTVGPDPDLIAVGNFRVIVTRVCSGADGLGLVALFLAIWIALAF